MRKLLQEKGSVFKKIMSWILVMVILFTSADMSAFVVAAEEQNEIVLSDGSSDSNEISSEIQQNDSSVLEQETLDSSVTEEGEEQLQMDTPEEEQLFSDGAEEIQPEEEVLSDGTESDTELAANTKGNPVQWSTMSYNGGRIYLSYRYKGVNHSNRNYPWIYGKDAATSELHVAYCIEPDVDDITKWYTLHNKPLTEHPTFKNDPAKAKRMLEYAYFGAEYPGHWSTNELQAEYFMAAQELIWEELGVSNISWHRQTSGGGAGASLNSVVDTRKAEIKRDFRYISMEQIEEAPSAATIKIPNKLRKIDISLNLIKEDAEHPGTYLPGAVFEITPDGYDPIRVTTTDSPDGVRVENLPRADSYSVQEIQAPEGYILDPTIYTYTLEEFENEYGSDGKTITAKRLSVNCDNKSVMGNLRIRKMDQENGELLSGAEFEIRKGVPPQSYEDAGSDQYEKVGIITIGMDGTGEYNNIPSHMDGYDMVTKAPHVTSKKLSYGTYYVKEITPPDGYKVNDKVYTVTFKENIPLVAIGAEDEAYKGSISVVKKDSATDQPLKGVIFAIFTAEEYEKYQKYQEEGSGDIEELSPIYLTTDEMGQASTGNILELGQEYVMIEYAPPAGYDPPVNEDGSEKVWRFTPTKDEMIFEYEIENTKQREIIIHKTDENGNPVNGVVFGLFSYGTQLNGQEGTVVIDGTGVNDIYTYTHKNKIVMGQLKIKKADPAGKALAGAQFAIYTESGSDGEPVDSITTGEDGTATSKLLPYGWYIVRETKAPEGYELDTNLRLRCRISENEQIVEFTVMNYPGNEPGIYIVKYDKDNPNKYLEGAQFDLYKDSALTEKIGGPYVTEENGQVKITDTDALNKGETYYLKETRAPEGYQLDETAHSFVWGETTTIALYIPNEKEKGYIRFEKTGEMLSEIKDDLSYPNLKELVWEQQQLSGAQIGIYATEEIELDGKTYQPGDLIVRLESGETSPGLPLGTYEYQELSAPPSYILDTQRHKVEVTETTTQIEPAFVSLENQHASVNLQLYKKFSDENTSEKLKQVKFGVYTVGTVTSGKVQIEPDTLVGVFGVDENGFANPELKLPQGSYYVRELETADGYLLDETRYPFKVVYDNGNEKIIISSKENPIVNEPVYGVIRLEKKGELFTQVEVSIEENKYQVNRPVFTQGELNGAKVEIRAKETVTIGDSTYQPGEVIDTLISGEKPESRKLPFGTYTVVEVEAPEGYVLDSTPRDVTIRAPEEGSHVHTVELVSLTNAKKKVDLNLYKSFFGLEIEEAEELYQKVLFGVYAAEDIPGAADGVSLKKDTLVELIRIEADGSGGMEKALLPAGNYYVKELETADGYQVDDTHYPFSVSFGKDVSDTENSDTGSDTITVEVEGIDAEHPLINLPEGAEVPFAFRKIGEDGQPLAGAVFRLYTCKEEHEHSQEAGTESSCWEEVHGLSPKTSGADGIVDFGILPNGTYQLKETEAPEGYVLPAGQWRFTVNSEAEPGEHIIFTPTGGAQPPAFQKAEEDAVYQYQVMNRKARQMPFTGGTGMLDYAAGGGALLALAELVNRRRKKKNKGNVQ